MPIMKTVFRGDVLLYATCAFLSSQWLVSAVHIPPPRFLQGDDDDEYDRCTFNTLSWSVVLPALSISFLSWLLKNGKRCCTYADEAVMDDIVPCNFVAHPEEHPVEDVPAEDIELEDLPPCQYRLSHDDPADSGIAETCNCTQPGEEYNVNDSSFSWIKDSENADYLNTDT